MVSHLPVDLSSNTEMTVARQIASIPPDATESEIFAHIPKIKIPKRPSTVSILRWDLWIDSSKVYIVEFLQDYNDTWESIHRIKDKKTWEWKESKAVFTMSIPKWTKVKLSPTSREKLVQLEFIGNSFANESMANNPESNFPYLRSLSSDEARVEIKTTDKWFRTDLIHLSRKTITLPALKFFITITRWQEAGKWIVRILDATWETVNYVKRDMAEIMQS